MQVPGIGNIAEEHAGDFTGLDVGGDGLYRVGVGGVRRVLLTRDRKVEFIVHDEHTLAYVRSAMGHPAIYPLRVAPFEPPAEAVLMDLDGTSVRSEGFWMWIIERTMARLMGEEGFRLAPDDEPHVSGHSLSEHLKYCIDKYFPSGDLEAARGHYFDITRHEMAEILAGRGRADAFRPTAGLKEFLLALKDRGIRIGLVTSGLEEKAWPEIVSAFRQLDMGDPRDFYDAIICAGQSLGPGRVGTLGELEPKPHPWPYAETVRVGLGMAPSSYRRAVAIEDSGAGVVSVRLAGVACLGLAGGNIHASGTRPLLHAACDTLDDALAIILGETA